jgi:crotonobetainyl-CoA:carnitine CoA-transferase CaiB-like acyl-CoA transferase
MEQGIDSPYEPAPPEGTSIPTLIPVNALDCFTGHNLALGTLAGLYRRAIEGGSWLVQGSLLQSAMFIQTLPRHDRATVKRLWKRYPAWPLEFDGATLNGQFVRADKLDPFLN